MSPTTSCKNSYILDDRTQPVPVSLSLPIPNSYWTTPLLCASEYPFSPGHKHLQLDKLFRADVRTFIDLTELEELLPYECHLRTCARAVGIPDTEELWYYRFPIKDRCTPSNDGQTMLGIMAILQKYELAGNKAVIHCQGGIGRTGTVVGCWFIQSGRVKDGEGALQAVKALWRKVDKYRRFPNSPETGQQCEFVKRFAKVVLADDPLDGKLTLALC